MATRSGRATVTGRPVLLAAERLSIGFGRRVIATEIDLPLHPGSVTVLLGPNGGGKTTLLRTLLGLAPPIAGRVLLNGEDLRRLPRALIARHLAYVPQATAGLFAYTAREVVTLGRATHLPALSTPGPRDRALADAALQRLGITHLADRPVTAMSGGERQLVLIARALAQEATVLIMDEPTASLDFGNQALVLHQVRSLAAEGLAVLLTTHHPDHAFLVADAVALLPRGGRLVGPGTPEALVTRETLHAMYGIDAVVAAVDTPGGEQLVCAPVIKRERTGT